MYQYFFEGDTVRLAYWRIDYDENRTMYANTEDDKMAIVGALTEQGFTPTVTPIDQTDNEWIDGKCFTDHSAVDAALAAGEKNFICCGDDEDVANTLTIMNETKFSVDKDGVWQITTPGIPSLQCYSIMTCVSVRSIDNQKISINGAEPIGLYKDWASPVMADDIVAENWQPLPLQINVVHDTAAYVNLSVNDGWSIGEVKSFAYQRPDDASKLLCDGNPYDIERYPLLYEKLGFYHGLTPDFIVRHTFPHSVVDVAAGKGIFVIAAGSNGLYYSTDCISWTQVSTATVSAVRYSQGMFVAYGDGVIKYSTDGKVWSDKVLENFSTSYGTTIYALVCSPFDGTWVLSVGPYVYYSTDNMQTLNRLFYNKNYTCDAIIPLNSGWVYVIQDDRDYTIYYTRYTNSIEKVLSTNADDYMTLSTDTTTRHIEQKYFIAGDTTYVGKRDELYTVDTVNGQLKACANPYQVRFEDQLITPIDDRNAYLNIYSSNLFLTLTSPTNSLIWSIKRSCRSNIEHIAYDDTKSKVIAVDASNNIYTMNASKPALPLLCTTVAGTEEFKYIKAE